MSSTTPPDSSEQRPATLNEMTQAFAEGFAEVAREPYTSPPPTPLISDGQVGSFEGRRSVRHFGSVATWDLVMEINTESERMMREHRQAQRNDDFRGQFDLDIIYDSPSPEMGIQTVRIIVRGLGNRANYAYAIDIREFIAGEGSTGEILRNGVLLAIDSWRTIEQDRVQSRLTGMSAEEWNARYEEAREEERREYQRRFLGEWATPEQDPVDRERLAQSEIEAAIDRRQIGVPGQVQEPRSPQLSPERMAEIQDMIMSTEHLETTAQSPPTMWVEGSEQPDGEIRYQVRRQATVPPPDDVWLVAPLHEDEDFDEDGQSPRQATSEAIRRRNEARRRRLREIERSRDNEPDPELVKTVLSGLKPLF